MLQKPTHVIGEFREEVQKSKVFAWFSNPVLYMKKWGMSVDSVSCAPVVAIKISVQVLENSQ